MSDANFASLSSSLLARKGGAKPAMRPQSGIQGPVDGKAAAANLEDLGWNDMGEDAPAAAETPVVAVPAPRVVSIAPRKELAGDAESGLTLPAPNQVRESIDRIQAQIEKPAAPRAAAPVKAAPAAPFAAPAEASPFVDAAPPVAVAVPRAAPAPRAPARRPSNAAAAAMARRAAFTLRLDHERHLQLRLACTVRGRSAQQLVTDALDSLLAEMPEIASLAAQVKRDSH